MMIFSAILAGAGDLIGAFDLQPLYDQGGFAVKVADFIVSVKVFFQSSAVAFGFSMIGNVVGYLYAYQRSTDRGFGEVEYKANKLWATILIYELPVLGFAYAIPEHGAWIGAVVGLLFQIAQTAYKNITWKPLPIGEPG